MLASLPTGPRDFVRTPDLVAAGHSAAQAWLGAGLLTEPIGR
jgi:hypothetical protein